MRIEFMVLGAIYYWVGWGSHNWIRAPWKFPAPLWLRLLCLRCVDPAGFRLLSL